MAVGIAHPLAHTRLDKRHANAGRNERARMTDREPIKADGLLPIYADKNHHVVANMHDVERVEKAWAMAIGCFIVAFANLEEWTRLFLRTFGDERQRAVSVDHRLSVRLAAMEAVVARLRLKDAVRARFDKAVGQLRSLTPHRNLLAHHPPAVQIYTENADGSGAMEVRYELVDSNDPNISVTVDLLEADVRVAKDAEQELALLYGEVRQPKNRRPA